MSDAADPLHPSPRQQLARRQLAAAYTRYADAIVLHYSCGDFTAQAADRPIFHVVAKRLHDGAVPTFGANGEAERASLERFTAYIDAHPSANWINWNFRDSKFGFEAIAARQKFLNVTPAIVPDEQRIDLSRLLWNIHGDNYIQNPKLAKLAERNSVNVRDMLDTEAAKQCAGNSTALLASTCRKVEIIEAIFILAAEHKLVTDLSPAAADPFEIASWFEIHVKNLNGAAIRQAATRNRIRKIEIRKGLTAYSVADVRRNWPEKKFLSDIA